MANNRPMRNGDNGIGGHDRGGCAGCIPLRAKRNRPFITGSGCFIRVALLELFYS